MSSILPFHSYVKFLTCQDKPSKLLQGLNVTDRLRGLTYTHARVTVGYVKTFYEIKR